MEVLAAYPLDSPAGPEHQERDNTQCHQYNDKPNYDLAIHGHVYIKQQRGKQQFNFLTFQLFNFAQLWRQLLSQCLNRMDKAGHLA